MKYLEQAKRFKNDEEYYNDYEFITNSQLGWFEKSPMYYDYRKRVGAVSELWRVYASQL